MLKYSFLYLPLHVIKMGQPITLNFKKENKTKHCSISEKLKMIFIF